MGKSEPPSPTLLKHKRLWMTDCWIRKLDDRTAPGISREMYDVNEIWSGALKLYNYQVYYWTISNDYFVYLSSWLCVLMQIRQE